MYGERTDALNAGVPTDRLIAEWDIDVSRRKPGRHYSWTYRPCRT